MSDIEVKEDQLLDFPLEEFSDETIKEEDEYLRELVYKLTGDEFHHYVKLPDNRLLAIPTVLKLYYSGYSIDAISRITGIPVRKVQKWVKLALRVAVVDEIKDVRLTIYHALRDYQRIIADKAKDNPRWARIYLEVLRMQSEVAGLIADHSTRQPTNVLTQVVVNTGSTEQEEKKSPPQVVVNTDDVVDGEIVDDSGG